MNEEGMQKTSNNMIYIGRPIEMDDVKFMDQLKHLDEASKKDDDDIKNAVAEVVETYKP